MNLRSDFLAHAVPLSTPGTDVKDFSDLDPLRRLFENRRVVLLGEHSHGDGAAFAMKARLATFLYRELGFDALAFEAGLYDCAAAWRLLSSTRLGASEAMGLVRKAIPGIWAHCAQVQPLLETMVESVGGPRPLELLGFDCQTGALAQERLTHDLQRLLVESSACTRADWERFAPIVDAAVSAPHPQPASSWPQQDNREKLVATLRHAEHLLSVSELGTASALDSGIARSVRLHIENIWEPDQEGRAWRVPYMRRRELALASLLRWWTEEQYPDRRIIVWAHQGHLLRRVGDVPSWTDWHVTDHTAGEATWLARPKDVYAVGFSTCGGSIGRVGHTKPASVPVPSQTSLEGAMLSAGYDAAFVDFTRVPASTALRPCGCRLKGYREVVVDPQVHVDGLVLLRESVPAVAIEQD